MQDISSMGIYSQNTQINGISNFLLSFINASHSLPHIKQVWLCITVSMASINSSEKRFLMI